ncbi:MAG: acyl-CoA dehydrogenase family protein [Actinomycetes bacterium]
MTTVATDDLTIEAVDQLVDQLLADLPPATTGHVEFLGAQFDRGLAWVHFEHGCGGLGGSPSLTGHVGRRLQAAGAPIAALYNVIGHGMVAPTIAVHGTEEQKAKYLRPLFTGEEVWCQLFSEPGAGSDVAALATRAIRDGDEWVLNGQKVWTTLAHLSRYGLILARTDPDQPKHRGITCFLVDMEAPGVDVRPLYQATGEAEFNECFFTDVRVADADRLGDVGQGWGVGITTLMNERVSIGGQVPPRGSGPIAHAVEAFKARYDGDTSTLARVERDRLMALWVRSEVTRLTNKRASDNRKAGTPGPEGSVAKLAYAEINQLIYSLAVEMMGPGGMLYSSEYPMVRPLHSAIGSPDLQKSFLRVQANSIEGGTSLIMRNILGERVLGLPGEPRNDKDVAWNQIPKS